MLVGGFENHAVVLRLFGGLGRDYGVEIEAREVLCEIVFSSCISQADSPRHLPLLLDLLDLHHNLRDHRLKHIQALPRSKPLIVTSMLLPHHQQITGLLLTAGPLDGVLLTCVLCLKALQ